jgi:hypothetical protein
MCYVVLYRNAFVESSVLFISEQCIIPTVCLSNEKHWKSTGATEFFKNFQQCDAITVALLSGKSKTHVLPGLFILLQSGYILFVF